MSSDQGTDAVSHCGPEFWKHRWVVNDIRFHKERNHPYVNLDASKNIKTLNSSHSTRMLEKHLDKMVGEKTSVKILFPLCGKAVDMIWYGLFGI